MLPDERSAKPQLTAFLFSRQCNHPEHVHHHRESAMCALQGDTGLTHAAREGHVAIVKELLAHGADANLPEHQVQSCCLAPS